MRAVLLLSFIALICNSSFGASADARQSSQAKDQKKEFAKCWEYKSAPDASVHSQSDAANVYFIDIDRRLIAVDLLAGTNVWSTDLGGVVVSNLLVTSDSVLVVTGRAENGTISDTVLRSVSKQTGITSWFVKLSAAPTASIAAVDGTVLVIGADGTVSGYAATNGDVRWTKPVGAKITTAPYVSGSLVYVGTDRSDITSLATSSGDLKIVAKTDSVPVVLFSDASGRIVTGDDRGHIVLTSADGKRLWRFRNGARISSISMYDSEFLATSNDNFVYKLSRGGNVEWKRRLSSRIDGQPLVLDNVAIFPTVGDGNVYVIDLTNGKILNRFEHGENKPAQAVSAGSNFVMLTEEGLTLYTRTTCPPIKKTVSG